MDLSEAVSASAHEIAAQHVAPLPEPAAELATTPKITHDTASDPSPASIPDPALVEAVVQRILDKMRPQVVDIITREFLRPVVQALVHREIEKQ